MLILVTVVDNVADTKTDQTKNNTDGIQGDASEFWKVNYMALYPGHGGRVVLYVLL